MFVRMGGVIVNTERVTHLFNRECNKKYEIVVCFDNGQEMVVARPTKDNLKQTLDEATQMLNKELVL